MARTKLEDLPVLEDLNEKEAKGVSGGNTGRALATSALAPAQSTRVVAPEDSDIDIPFTVQATSMT